MAQTLTLEPTAVPTTSPTLTTDTPTILPTKIPTKSSSNPTKYPTQAPSTTLIPTSTPTLAPTSTPTLDTNSPSESPVESPTIATITPTNILTTAPTTVPTNTPTELANNEPDNSDGELSIEEIKSHEKAQRYFEITSIVVISTFLIIGVLGYIDARYIRTNSIYSITSILIGGLYTYDMISDIFFTYDVYISFIYLPDKDELYPIFFAILVIGLITIIFPLITTIFQLHRASTNVWSKNQYNGSAIRAWLTQYSKVMYFISLLTGSSFTSIELVNTNLFSLVVLNMGLPRKDIYSFRNQRITSSVLCEVCVVSISLHAICMYNIIT